ncbi:hypothetical protein I6A60_06490 [Frankia sp. AgB1.9]|uniref:DUF6049 family protein n=1 Tax=unclassified Frankia TaxID=2632575 RepID=UPI00193394AE|nr:MULTISPECIES: DUF6049 family protein [unclassified Frankia]MBL7489764.1 hypothetical protein [Frankia sp. AgW1.1]MBL7547525.1 hypothetical protein [Frankia sp. AgB1.9]MBL7624367.1 hypothetical protein [Frankia sp. AgB1.8]
MSTGLSTGSTATASPGSSATAGVPSAAGSSATTATTGDQVHIVGYDGIASPDKPLTLNGHIDLSTPLTGLTVEASVIKGGVDPARGRDELAKLRADPTLSGKARYTTPVTTPVPFDGSDFSINQKPRIANKPLTIYAMKITVSTASGKEVGAAYTFLVWAPEQAGLKATSLSIVLPIADYPRIRSDGMLTDNQLAAELKGPDGRLYRVLHSVPSNQASSIALAVDPTLLMAVQKMADGAYSYADPGGKKDAPANLDAKNFLASLTAFAKTPGNVVFPLPWGDADLTALIRAGGQHDSGQLNDALGAVDTGEQTLRDVLGVSDLPPVAYPGDGLADAATLAFLAHPNVGMTTAVLDDRLLPATSKALSETPSALTVQTTANGPIRVLAADSKLADLMTPKISQDGLSQPQALADVLAELATITNERTGATTGRLAVLALPRLWSPPTDDWGLQALSRLALPASPTATYQPFFQPVALPVAPKGAAGTTTSTGTTAAFGPAGIGRNFTYPAWAQASEIPTSYVDAVEHLRAEVRQLDPALCAVITNAGKTSNPSDPARCALTDAGIAGSKFPNGRTSVIAPMLNTLLTALSVDWRPDRSGAVRLSQEVDGRINLLQRTVKVVASPKVTLTSRNGTVPVNVQNVSGQGGDEPYPMTVILSLSSNDKTRLRSAARMALTVEPGAIRQVEISVSSDAAGTFPVFVQVLTPDGQRLSAQPVRILVRSTAYGSIATAITYVTIGLFVVAVVLRQVRRSRRKRHGGGSDDGPGGPVVDVTPTDPNASGAADRATMPIRRIQANAAGTQRTEVERAYAGGVPANPSEP